MDAVLLMAKTVLEAARRTTDIQCYGAAKLVVFANMVEDSPFMAGAVHGSGEADAVILGSKIPVNVAELFVLFIERTVITLPIIVLMANLFF